MNKTLFITIFLLAAAATPADAANLRFDGCDLPPYSETPSAATGLDGIYVLHATAGVSVTLEGINGANAVWKTFGYLGAAHAENVDPSYVSHDGQSTTLNLVNGDTGYAVSYGTDTYYFWVVDYSAHPFSIQSLTPSAEQDCGSITFDFAGTADRITYYGINARSYELNRGITLSYRTLEANREQVVYTQVEKQETFASLGETFHATAPLCDTPFTLSGDKFLTHWGQEISYDVPTVTAHAIDIITSAEQIQRDSNDNEIKTDATLGGSAPIEIQFKGAVTDAAAFHEWQMSHDPEFGDIEYRNRDLDVTYTFTEMGTYYMRLSAANQQGECAIDSEPYVVTVAESVLRCPNAFSPGASEGVNDIWRVSYKSIVSFECYIFDRWGTKMTEFHDPSQGWDGHYRGKLVPAGVYYYVIKARGSDGKNYNLSGDINILRSNR